MTNRGGELHLPAMPACYLEYWHEVVWPHILKEHGGDTTKGSILDKKVISTDPELERIKKFGPSWTWMSLSKAAKAELWEQG